jgi:valyl-tRNA synthetase
VEANRNFANKLWNAGRYLLGNLKALSEADREALAVTSRVTAEELKGLGLAERFTVSLCHELVDKVTAGLEAYEMVRRGGRM